MIDKDYLTNLFKQCDIDITSGMADKFDIYGSELVSWNEKINLTAITEPGEICEKHFLDSVLPFVIWKKFSKLNAPKIIDVGTGAGFPSIPLKIVFPEIKITMLDSLNKRINFLNNTLSVCGLEGETIHGRAEELGHKKENRGRYDIATARAVANLSHLSEYCLSFVKIGGYFVALKGQNGQEELKTAQNAIKTLGGVVEEAIDYSLPSGDKRVLVIVRKQFSTPEKYPRNKGQMTKKPL